MKLLGFAVASIFAFFNTLNADITVSTIPEAEFTPPSNAVAFNPLLPNAASHRNVDIRWRTADPTDRADFGQRFEVAEKTALSQIFIYTPNSSGKKQTDPARSFSVIIEHFVEGKLSGHVEAISTQSGVLPSLPSHSYVLFELSNPVVLEANQLYGFRFTFGEALNLPDTKNFLSWGGCASGSASYPFGAYRIDYRIDPTPRPLSNPESMVFYLVGQPVSKP